VRLLTVFLLILTIFPFSGAQAEPSDNSLRVYAVHILQEPVQWPNGDGINGAGIYLGKGLVITAAHVVKSNTPGVRMAGLILPAKIAKIGKLDQVDLALLSVDEEKLPISLRLRRMPLCQRPPWVGEPVIVAIPESTARSRVMSPFLLPPVYRARFRTVISDVATTGNSGSGVFDAERKCLLGIMSLKIFTAEQKDIAKYFVPASTILAFLPTGTRF